MEMWNWFVTIIFLAFFAFLIIGAIAAIITWAIHDGKGRKWL